jgi:hypothetical protein
MSPTYLYDVLDDTLGPVAPVSPEPCPTYKNKSPPVINTNSPIVIPVVGKSLKVGTIDLTVNPLPA